MQSIQKHWDGISGSKKKSYWTEMVYWMDKYTSVSVTHCCLVKYLGLCCSASSLALWFLMVCLNDLWPQLWFMLLVYLFCLVFCLLFLFVCLFYWPFCLFIFFVSFVCHCCTVCLIVCPVNKEVWMVPHGYCIY